MAQIPLTQVWAGLESNKTAKAPRTRRLFLTDKVQNVSLPHAKMVKALNEIVVPKLRQAGFKGSFPHFRRLRDKQIDLLTFQFDRHGGGFVIEIGKCPPGGYTTSWDKIIPPDKITAWDVNDRQRLQPGNGGSPSDWFRYDRPILLGNIYDKTAKKVLPFLPRAEAWWREGQVLT